MAVSKSSVVNKFGFMLISILILQIAVCAKTDDVDPAAFKIYILKPDIHSFNLGYELEESWTILQNVNLADNYRVLNGDDIQVYHWSSQTITLTQEASTYFKGLPDDILFHLGRDSAFVITLNEKKLYGGCFLDFDTPMALKFPVIFFFMLTTGNLLCFK
jgi:hypothetical protein